MSIEGVDVDQPIFEVQERHDVEEHHFRVLRPVSQSWIHLVADEYRRLRTESRLPARALSLEGVEILNLTEVENRLAQATVPTYQQGNFGVARSDLAEIILGLVQQREYKSLFGYRSIRDRELRQRPGRGIDQIGVEVGLADGGPRIALILGEAKLSTDSRCPPGVVDTGDECLSAQHLAHLSNPQATADKVWDASRSAIDADVQEALRIAAELLRKGMYHLLRVVAASLMVRPENTSVPADFGSFHTSPNGFAPAQIRFLLVRLPGDSDTIAATFAQLAGPGSGPEVQP